MRGARYGASLLRKEVINMNDHQTDDVLEGDEEDYKRIDATRK
jgi:hypothetical protein